jgi:hypothetical protein
MDAPKDLLRVASAVCDAHRTSVRLRFPTTTASVRNGFSKRPVPMTQQAIQGIAT